MRTPKQLLKFSLLIVLGLLVAAHSDEPLAGDCAHDYLVSVRAESGDLWSAYGGEIAFHEEKNGPFVRFTFQADPTFLRFDQDASLRVRTAFACRPGERPLAIEAEIRTSATLSADSELNDIMLLGQSSRMLPGAGVRAAGEWQRIRIVVPHDVGGAGDFTALHFGAGAGWARERPGETITLDLRHISIVRSRPLYLADRQPPAGGARWLDPDRPEQPDARPVLLVAPGAPVFVRVEIPGGQVGTFHWHTPPGFKATVWHADWVWTEQKQGVANLQPIRLLTYSGATIPSSAEHPHQFWIRLEARAPQDMRGELLVTMGSIRLGRPLRSLPLAVPKGSSQFQMYYQMNENWTGYSKYANYYRNVSGHFQQLADFGFTGVHLADEPNYRVDGKRITADFSIPGRYWQKWPLPLGSVLAAAEQAGFHDPLVWEGLRIFTRDDVWAKISPPACGCDDDALRAAPVAPDPVAQRLPQLARAMSSGWKIAARSSPVLAIADEPGVHSDEEVQRLAPWLQALRGAGFRNYLTTHARLYDSFHRLGPWLDINVLHAEDVTAGAGAFVRRHQGHLWLYNGGSMNVGAPISDRFFAGVYGWLAGAEGITQWIYTRPSELQDPLDLRTRLQQDAQFYALPGRGSEPAATPGLFGFSAGIADRRLLDYAAASTSPRVQAMLRALRDGNRLPERPDEYAVSRMRSRASPAKFRDALLLALAGS